MSADAFSGLDEDLSVRDKIEARTENCDAVKQTAQIRFVEGCSTWHCLHLIGPHWKLS